MPRRTIAPSGDEHRAPERHLAAARAITALLAEEFPHAGIGITGSVAAGTHHSRSDLDIVVADSGFCRDVQFATSWNRIPVAIVCLRRGLLQEEGERWLLSSGGDVRITSMIRSAVIVRDPEGSLAELQRAFEELDAARAVSRSALMLAYARRADALVHAIAAASRPEPLLARLTTVVLDGWCVEHGVRLVSKLTSRELFEMIARDDPGLAELLGKAVPATTASLDPLQRAVDLVFGANR
jgi:hypothetical protein